MKTTKKTLPVNPPEEWVNKVNVLEQESAPENALSVLMHEGIDRNDPLMPIIPIQATPEISFYRCSPDNYTSGRNGHRIRYIVVHYTGAGGPSEGSALANCKYFARNSVGASAHFFIDNGHTIWCSVPVGDTAWHCGDWSTNQESIGIEVCGVGPYTSSEIERLAWLVQHLMKKYNIDANHVIRHYDVTGKHCPAPYIDKDKWAELKNTILGTHIEIPNKPNPGHYNNNTNVIFTYKVRTNEDGWLPEVNNLDDYAGIVGHKITDLAIKVNTGRLYYQVHVLGGNWLPVVTGYNVNDYANGYAGNGTPIDAIKVYYETPKNILETSGYLKAQYRVSILNCEYYDWQFDTEEDSTQDGYAGYLGRPIDRFQLF